MRRAILAALAVLATLPFLTFDPARAARPLLNTRQWDAYFALFAPDELVPWKHASVRLDTYSGAPVDFAAYAVDPVEVIVAGADSRPRAIDTSRRTPAARWRFVPPPGYKFETNDVSLPLGGREGFFVVEARRGAAAQQVWVNLSRIGLVTRESPSSLVVYGCDLRSGRPLGGMRISYLAGGRLVDEKTDAHGISRPSLGQRPRFALAQWGPSVAFVSFLPQSPVPPAIVGIRLERTVLHAGERAQVIGFVRRRNGAVYRPAAGDVRLLLSARGRALSQNVLHLDAAGAFSGEIGVPEDTPAGDFAVIATSQGATGAAAIHVDAAGDADLSVAPTCGSTCPASSPIEIAVRARRAEAPVAGLHVRVRVVRTPHVLPPGEPEDVARWGTTLVVDRAVVTGPDGAAEISIPAPSDGLDSTYSVVASTASATAGARVVVAQAPIALAVEPEKPRVDVGTAIGLTVRGFDATDGTPAAGTFVKVRLEHGPEIVTEDAKLDAEGRARLTFPRPPLGTDFLLAHASAGGRDALDAASVTVEPSALGAETPQYADDFPIELDRARYRPGQRIAVGASLAGATGDALVSLDGAASYGVATVDVRGGRAAASLPFGETLGDDRIDVALVRDGAVYASSSELAVDGPGHPRKTALVADRPSYAPGEIAHVAIRDGGLGGGATLALRLTDVRPNRGAAFEDAPDLLAASATTSQITAAAEDESWHAFVTPARSTAGNLLGFDRPRTIGSPDAALAVAAPKTELWRVERENASAFDVTVPQEPGRYVLSVLKIADDGDVGAASLGLLVR